MTNAFAKLETAFHRFNTLTVPERRAYLKALETADPDLLSELQGLLAASEGDAHTLDAVVPAATRLLVEPANRCGETMGRFQLVELLGSGGMGSVYRAERADGAVEQTVAIKVLNAEALTPDLRAAFEREQNILARLEHPLIARMIDVGLTAAGEPFFAMEYVQGQDLLSYVREHELSRRATLRLFRRICDAIAYAHGQLIVHRDIKPNNILVSADGVPRILDFGIASLVEMLGSRASQPALAAHGGMTFPYASPEQVRREPSGVPTDIFALGVLLHHLVLDQVPFAATEEASRLAQIEAGLPLLETSLAQRGGRLEARELASIIQRCLAFESADRYSAIGLLVEDLKALQRKQPISTLASSSSYRLRKFLLRNGALTAVLGGSLVVLAGATAVYLNNLAAARTLAETEAARAERTSAFLGNLFENIDPDNSLRGDFRVTDLLGEAPERIVQSFADDEAAAVRLLNLVARTLRKLGDYDGATGIHETIADRYGVFLEDDAQALSETLFERGYVAMLSGEYTDALDLHEQALSLREAAPATPPAKLAASQREVAYLYTVKGRFEESLALQEAPLAWYAAAGPEYRSQYAAVLLDRAGNFFSQNQPALAEAPAERALAVQIEVHGEKHSLVAQALHNLGVLQRMIRDYEAAEAYIRRAVALRTELFGADHPNTLSSRMSYASAVWDRGFANLARVRLRELEQTIGDDSFRFRDLMYYNLAVLSAICGRREEARNYVERYRSLIDTGRATATRSTPESLNAQVALLIGADQQSTITLAGVRALTGKAADRNATLNQLVAALAEYRRLPGERRTEVQRVAFDAVTADLSSSRGFRSPDIALWLDLAARAFLADGDGPRARRYLEQAFDIAEGVHGANALENVLLRVTQAEWVAAFGAPDEARQATTQADEAFQAMIEAAPEPEPLFTSLAQRLAALEPSRR